MNLFERSYKRHHLRVKSEKAVGDCIYFFIMLLEIVWTCNIPINVQFGSYLILVDSVKRTTGWPSRWGKRLLELRD